MRDEALKIVNQNQLVSCMNNTKWNELIYELNKIPCDKRVKYIDSNIISNWQPGAWIPVPGYVEFSGGPTQFSYIEWIEIMKYAFSYGRLASDRHTDRSSDINKILSKRQYEFTESESSFTIFGYKRTSQHPPAADRG